MLTFVGMDYDPDRAVAAAHEQFNQAMDGETWTVKHLSTNLVVAQDGDHSHFYTFVITVIVEQAS